MHPLIGVVAYQRVSTSRKTSCDVIRLLHEGPANLVERRIFLCSGIRLVGKDNEETAGDTLCRSCHFDKLNLLILELPTLCVGLLSLVAFQFPQIFLHVCPLGDDFDLGVVREVFQCSAIAVSDTFLVRGGEQRKVDRGEFKDFHIASIAGDDDTALHIGHR